jgi:predicted PurR-regulated permease PerM
VIVVVTAVLLTTVGVGGIIAHEVVTIAESFADRKEAIREKVINARERLMGNGSSGFGKLANDLEEIFFPKAPPQQTVVLEPSSPPLTSQLQPFLSPSAEILGQGALTLVLTIYMLIRREDLRNRMIRLVGNGRVTMTTKAVDEASQRISRYLLMQLMINVCFGLTIGLSLVFLGVNYVLLWCFLAALMRYVPYIGTWIGLIPPLLFSFATAPDWGGGWGQPAAVFAIYVVAELVVANVIEPWLYGTSIGLSEVAQLVATAFWAFIWGPIGLILAGPLTACLLVLGKYVRGLEFLEVVLGDEACAVALAHTKEYGPDATLDTILIPALSLIRRDRDDGEIDAAAFHLAIRMARVVAAEIEEQREKNPAESDAERVRVMICPARDEAEHLAAESLSSALDSSKWETRVIGNDVLASELVAAVSEYRPSVVVLVAVPPSGVSQCRYMANRIRTKYPDLRVLIGRWGDEEVLPAEVSAGGKHVDAVDRTFAGTRKRLAELHPVLLAEQAKSDLPEPRPEKRAEAATEKRDTSLVSV